MKTNNKKAKTLSIYSFMSLFPDEEKARGFIEKQLWDGKPVCPTCSSKKAYPRKKRYGYRCGDCSKDFTVRTGTIFEKSKLPLHKWLYSMYLVVTSRKGISSLQLSKELDITQKSAWFLLQRIREACNTDSGLLVGIVETYIGRIEKNKHNYKKTKTAVVGMKQREGRVIAKSFSKIDSNNLQGYIDGNVSKDATLSTDEASIYNPIKGYNKIMVNHSVSEFVNGMVSTNSIESIWSVLKRGYHGTFNHFSKKHIDRYVNEFIFRLNEENCKIDAVDRIKNIVLNMANKKLTYKELVNG